MPTPTDPHLNVIRPVSPRTPNGCQECLMLGSAWMHRTGPGLNQPSDAQTGHEDKIWGS